MIHCILIEDEKASQEILIKKLSIFYPEIKIDAVIDNIDEAENYLKTKKVDLVFLDNCIKGGNGIDLIKKITDRDFEIIFTTAFAEFAIDALNNKATYYLLKPYSDTEFSSALEIFIKNNSLKTGKILIGSHVGSINFNTIQYLKSEGSYTTFFIEGGKKILTSKNIGYYEKKLPLNSFFRIHHSIVVNTDKIDRLEIGKKNSLYLKNSKVVLPISIRKVSSFLEKYKL
jgi:two-component system LytT family response regulator